VANVEEGDDEEGKGDEGGGVGENITPEGTGEGKEEYGRENEENNQKEAEKHGDDEVDEAFVLELLECLSVILSELWGGVGGGFFDEMVVRF